MPPSLTRAVRMQLSSSRPRRRIRMLSAASSLPLLLVIACLCCAPAHASFSASELQACYKEPALGSRTLTFDEYMTGSPSRLHLHAVLEEPRSHKQPESALTIATALNAARLDSLIAQCESWPGLLIAALYHPVVRQQLEGPGLPTAQEAKEITSLESEARAAIKEAQGASGSCQLRVLLLYEYVDSDFMAALIPINALRNAAILAADTPLVAMVDVDLLISANLGQLLVTGQQSVKQTRSQQLIQQCQTQRVAMILPAFQTPKNTSSNSYPSGQELEESIKLVQKLVKGSKSDLADANSKGQVIPFASQQFSIGHRRTNFRRWFQSGVHYQVEFIKQFEPWYIVDRLRTPLYDVNFRGYGRNKQQQAAHLDALGIEFWVHPDSFLIHMPHEKSDAQKDHDHTWSAVRQRHNSGLRPARGLRMLRQQSSAETDASLSQGLRHVRRVDTLFRKFVLMMPANEYRTLVDAGTAACLEKLSWWKGSTIRQHCKTSIESVRQ